MPVLVGRRGAYMAINRDKPDQWKSDMIQSVDLYNAWFMEFAPKVFRETRIKTAKQVEIALRLTSNLSDIEPKTLATHPFVLPILRMSTCPPIARDRLTGLAGVPKSLVSSMEDSENPRVPPRMPESVLMEELGKIKEIITKMADPDIFVWLNREEPVSDVEIKRAATIVADRLCGSVSDPIIRNAQEKRQLDSISSYLRNLGYSQARAGTKYNELPPGTYAFHVNIPVKMPGNDEKSINVAVDVAILPKSANIGELPLLIEATTAGDFTNVNKRRKEEAQKMSQFKYTYGNNVQFCLFLCGYYDSGYLGYEAAEGIDWIWEHRIEDLYAYNL